MKTYLRRHVPLLIALFGLGLVFTLSHESFLTRGNLQNILEQITVQSLLAFGMTFVILLGGIDLSVGSTLAFSGMTAVWVSTMTSGFGWPLAAGLAAGGAVGAFNGALIALARMPPFIVTLASMSVARGLAFVYTRENWGEPLYIPKTQKLFLAIADWQIAFLAGFFLLSAFLLRGTRFGHYVYAIGGNREAARFTGLPARRVEFSVYVLTGLMAGLAGLLNTSLLWSGDPNAGNMYELSAIAAVVVGGASFTGGIGTISGTLIGAMIIGVLANGLNLLGAHFSTQHMVKGLVIVLAVALDVIRRRGKSS